MNGEMYIIWVDGNFVGVTEEEDYCWDIVGDAVNGVAKPILDDDIPDRVEINKINVYYNKFNLDAEYVEKICYG